jgi:hypothetical protein
VREVDHRCDKQGCECRPVQPREYRSRDDPVAAGKDQEAWLAEQLDAAIRDAPKQFGRKRQCPAGRLGQPGTTKRTAPGAIAQPEAWRASLV